MWHLYLCTQTKNLLHENKFLNESKNFEWNFWGVRPSSTLQSLILPGSKQVQLFQNRKHIFLIFDAMLWTCIRAKQLVDLNGSSYWKQKKQKAWFLKTRAKLQFLVIFKSSLFYSFDVERSTTFDLRKWHYCTAIIFPRPAPVWEPPTDLNCTILHCIKYARIRVFTGPFFPI